MTLLRLFCCASVLVLSACAPQSATPSAEPGPSRILPGVADDILVEVNRARHRVGAPPLVAWEPLNGVAQQYAAELAARGVLDHNSPIPGRETMGRRLDAAGVVWRRAAENLAYRLDAAADLPRAVVSGWLGSEGHAANLLQPAFTHSGVGLARNANGRWYVVQLYVLPQGDR
jgi:uncharacterized protein YkwD